MRDREFRQRARRINNNTPIGVILLAVGGVFLAKQLGVDFPHWFFSWEMLLIGIGILMGFKSKFRDFGWLIPIAIGLIFLADDFYPVKNFIWPALIILVGLFIILRPVRPKKAEPEDIAHEPVVIAPSDVRDDILDVTSVFGGSKRIVLSKNFRGGEVVSIFGGADINLTQADFTNPIKIEIVAIFGGCTLIVPSNWEIRSETVVIMGAIDDKRKSEVTANPEKVLILDGTVMFGGIEIKSY
ncbi:MAG TPA: DUF5668 domain-containing protein [Chitinophagaceae bacterium]